MSPQDALRQLQRLAQAGNPHARMALAGLVAQSAPTVLGRSPDDEIADRAGDDLEMASMIAEADMPGADDLDRKAALFRARQMAANQVAPLTNTNPSAAYGAGVFGNQVSVEPGGDL